MFVHINVYIVVNAVVTAGVCPHLCCWLLGWPACWTSCPQPPQEAEGHRFSRDVHYLGQVRHSLYVDDVAVIGTRQGTRTHTHCRCQMTRKSVLVTVEEEIFTYIFIKILCARASMHSTIEHDCWMAGKVNIMLERRGLD